MMMMMMMILGSCVACVGADKRQHERRGRARSPGRVKRRDEHSEARRGGQAETIRRRLLVEGRNHRRPDCRAGRSQGPHTTAEDTDPGPAPATPGDPRTNRPRLLGAADKHRGSAQFPAVPQDAGGHLHQGVCAW